MRFGLSLGTVSTAQQASQWKCESPIRSYWNTMFWMLSSTDLPRPRRRGKWGLFSGELLMCDGDSADLSSLLSPGTCSAPSRLQSFSSPQSWTGWKWACRCVARATTCWTCWSTERTWTTFTWITTSTWSLWRPSPLRYRSIRCWVKFTSRLNS